MRQIRLRKILAAVCSAGSLIAGSICLAASYLGPAIWLAGTNWENPAGMYADRSDVFRPLFVLSLILLGVGIAGTLWSLIPPRRAPA